MGFDVGGWNCVLALAATENKVLWEMLEYLVDQMAAVRSSGLRSTVQFCRRTLHCSVGRFQIVHWLQNAELCRIVGQNTWEQAER